MRPGRRTPALGLLAPLCALAALPLLGGQQLSPQGGGVGLSREEAMESARQAAIKQGIDPNLVEELGAPVAGEWDKKKEEKRCSACVGSMAELHAKLWDAAQMSWNLKRPAGLQGSKEHPKVTEVKEIPLQEAITAACGTAVREYAYGEVDGYEGYYHKRQNIVRTHSEQMLDELSEICERLAEDSDRNGLLAAAHLADRGALAWRGCVEQNKGEGVAGYFSGAMCTEEEGRRWMERLLPENQKPPAGDDDIRMELDEFKQKYGYRIEQWSMDKWVGEHAAGATGAEALFKLADADGNGRLSRAEIGLPKIRNILNPKKVNEALFVQQFGAFDFKKGRSAKQVFKRLDLDEDGQVTLAEMQGLHAQVRPKLDL